MSRNQKIGVSISILTILIIIGIIVLSLFSKPIYTVEFITNSDTSIKSQKVKAKDKVVVPVEPQREDFIFTGWYLNNEEFNFNTKVTKNIILEARWIPEEKKMITLSFDSVGGSVVENIEIEVGTILENIPNPTKEGFLFQGWYYLNKAYIFNKPIVENMTFIAKWKKES